MTAHFFNMACKSQQASAPEARRDASSQAQAATAEFCQSDVNRRQFALGAGVVALLAAHLPFAGIRPAAAAERVTWRDAMRAVIGDSVPQAGKVSLLMPEMTVGGHMVPFTVAVDSPMLSNNFVKSVHVFATENPRPDVASFFFSARSGRAEASSRMRLWGTQEVVAVAELSDGSVYLGKRRVRVLPALPTETLANDTSDE